MKFSLATIAYVFALLAAGMAVFGGVGIVASGVVLLLWLLVAKGTTLRDRVAGMIAACAAMILLGTIALMFPPAIEAARTSACLGRLSQLRLGILNHESAKGTLPQAIISGADGKAMHSWRFMIVPYMESSGLYRRYKMAEPWNGPRNAKLLAKYTMDCYQCDAQAGTGAVTHYLAVVDPRTAWPPDRGRKLDEFKDGAINTLLLIEAPHKDVPWAKPEDLSFDEAAELLSGDSYIHAAAHSKSNGPFHKPTRSLNVAFVDGRVETIDLPLPREVAIALLTVDGGEDFYREDLRRFQEPELDLAKCYALAAFVGLGLLPGKWLLRRARRCEGSPAGR